MQLIETSALGVRAATHVLKSDRFGARVTIFPMVHIGEAAFYADVYKHAAKHDLVLLEGVKSKTVRNLTRSYRWLPLKRMGLIRQPKFDPRYTKGDVKGADMTVAEYDALWRQIPVLHRAALAVGSPLFGLCGRFFMTRKWLAAHLKLNDLTSRDDNLAHDERLFPGKDAINAKRDQKACRILEEAIRGNGDIEYSIAIVYGAGHMPAIVRFLRELGEYRPVESEWKTVFEQ